MVDIRKVDCSRVTTACVQHRTCQQQDRARQLTPHRTTATVLADAPMSMAPAHTHRGNIDPTPPAHPQPITNTTPTGNNHRGRLIAEKVRTQDQCNDIAQQDAVN
eukprot:scpid99097/ scgid19949/ 